MLEFPRWKVWLIGIVIAIGFVLSIPSLIAGTPLASRWPAWAPQYRINLGLDLAGGSHLLLEADSADMQKQRLQSKEDESRPSSGAIRGSTSATFPPRAGGSPSWFATRPRSTPPSSGCANCPSRSASPATATGTCKSSISTRVVLTPTPSGSVQAMKDAMNVARDVVRRRIDPSGAKEITVVTEGSNRILVEVPGVENPDELKKLIGQTARLEFKLVDLSANPADVQQGHAPPGSQVLPMADGSGFVAVKRRVMVSGEQLTDAKQSFDQDGRPDIDITFNTAGARRFGRATQENVGKPFAIILDDKVLSAPNINEPILGGRAQISGNFTVQSAHDLAVSLASGKLPVKLNVIEERSIGPDLGKDSIHKGALASIISVVAVIVFMLVTYGRFGVYANIALVVNAFLILGVMAVFGANLTLPGIAGFILTIGAAVDANVLINERIREEIRRGRRILDAVDTGYKEAMRAIFDANVTHVISASIMAYFGSGPVRGFATVLLIGVVTSVFTAVYFTRMLVALWLHRARPRALHI